MALLIAPTSNVNLVHPKVALGSKQGDELLHLRTDHLYMIEPTAAGGREGRRKRMILEDGTVVFIVGRVINVDLGRVKGQH